MASVLLVEPDRSLALAYARALETAGHAAHVCPSAQTALEAADDVNPEVVLLELQLVAHSGVEFLYEFRSYADWQDVPVIILSKVPPAEFNQSIRMMQEHLGIAAYCYKPQTDLSHILHEVSLALSGSQLKVV